MKVLSRACGYSNLSQFNQNDLTTFKEDMAKMSGIKFGGIV